MVTSKRTEKMIEQYMFLALGTKHVNSKRRSPRLPGSQLCRFQVPIWSWRRTL